VSPIKAGAGAEEGSPESHRRTTGTTARDLSAPGALTSRVSRSVIGSLSLFKTALARPASLTPHCWCVLEKGG